MASKIGLKPVEMNEDIGIVADPKIENSEKEYGDGRGTLPRLANST